ncbi:DUF881 domain-containing protein [Georgenia daeguensis]|uniref:DUF881 domain-containing protein n=1 Tax=Georgenia daeguensis TaxID=908355 RepID=A0ABP8ERJ1_9MICO
MTHARDDAGGPGAPPAVAGPATRPRRPDESMSLLRELLENPLDAGYLAVAARAARPDRKVPAWRRGVVLMLCAAIGMGGVWAARELRGPQSGMLPARALLVEQIEERAAEGEELRAANEERNAEITSLRDAALSRADGDLLATVTDLGAASGQVAVRGPGIVVELEDSDAAQLGVAGAEDERVTDVDLQVLVNSLWASGAEAISVDGHRLGSTSAIRTAGEAILVNLDPVVSPYEVEVVGDPADLQTRLARTPASTHLGVLRSSYGIRVDIRAADELELEALPQLTPRLAEPLTSGDGGAGVSNPAQDVKPSGDGTAAARGRASEGKVG